MHIKRQSCLVFAINIHDVDFIIAISPPHKGYINNLRAIRRQARAIIVGIIKRQSFFVFAVNVYDIDFVIVIDIGCKCDASSGCRRSVGSHVIRSQASRIVNSAGEMRYRLKYIVAIGILNHFQKKSVCQLPMPHLHVSFAQG